MPDGHSGDLGFPTTVELTRSPHADQHDFSCLRVSWIAVRSLRKFFWIAAHGSCGSAWRKVRAAKRPSAALSIPDAAWTEAVIRPLAVEGG